MADPVTCANPKCGRQYNRVFAKCPFCNTPSKPAVAVPPAAAPAKAAPDYAALAAQVAAQHEPFVRLEFHAAAVHALDAFFDQTWGSDGLGAGNDAWEPNQGQRIAIVNLGTFFGEVIRRRFDGRWVPDPAEPDNPYKVRITVRAASGEVEVAPVTAAVNRMKNGAAAPFAAVLAQVRTMLDRGATADEARR